MRQFFAALLVVAVFLGAARAEVPVPPVKARVTDLTGTLSAQQKAELESRIAAYEARRGSQIAVLLLPSTKPEEIEQYAIRVAEVWKIGRKGVDDGLILVVAKDDRRLRIEVGYGLEGVIPDSVARRVIEERITPRFREGDFYGGVRDGVEQLIRLAEGEKLPEPSAVPGKDASPPVSLLEFVFVTLMFSGIAGIFLKKMFGRFPGSLAVALAAGLLGWLLFEAIVGAIAAIVVFLISIANVGTGRGGFYSGSGGWTSGSSGGSASWGGGGGSFGGGGSSGSW